MIPYDYVQEKGLGRSMVGFSLMKMTRQRSPSFGLYHIYRCDTVQ